MGISSSIPKRAQPHNGPPAGQLQKAQRKPSRITVHHMEHCISEHNQHIIVAHWDNLVRLQRRFFEETHREVFKARPNFEALSSDEMKISGLGEKVHDFLDVLITKCRFRKPNCDIECKTLRRVHEKHLRFGIKLAFVDVWIFVLERAIDTLSLEESDRERLKVAWRELIYYIVHEMTHTF